jgi:processive 1,2-diacylglycerol beta-glucosyltransferase
MRKQPKLFMLILAIFSIMSVVLIVGYQQIFNTQQITLGQYKGKILIMAVRASGGHLAAAKALKARLGRDGYVSDILMLDDYDPLRIGLIYDYAMRTSMGRSLLNLSTSIYWSAGGYYFMMASFIMEYWLKVGNYNCVVSVMPMTYKLIHAALARYNRHIPLIIIPTDLEDPVSGFWLDGQDAFYLLGSQQLMDQSAHLLNRFPISGMILRPEFTEDLKSKEERRQELNLPSDRKIVLVLFGASAAMEMQAIAEMMASYTSYHFVFICGKADSIRHSIDKIKLRYNAHYTVLGFTDAVHKWMQAADICVGKPGPGVVSECFASKLPVILCDSYDVLRQELCVLKHVARNQYGVIVKSWNELPQALDKLMRNYDEYYRRLAALPKNNALNEACDFIKRHLN